MEGPEAGFGVCAGSGVLVGFPNLQSEVGELSNSPSFSRLESGAGGNIEFPMEKTLGGRAANNQGVLIFRR